MSNILLPAIYQDHMMLQRGKPLTLRGRASSGHRITAELDGIRASAEITQGCFSIEFPALDAGVQKTLRFYVDDEPAAALEIRDISVGDIWMACGQSNMEYFLRYDANWNETRNLPRNDNIHMYNIPRIAFEGQQRPQEECGYWFKEGDEAWPLFSAPGYSFARTLQPKLHIPVGIIGCNWGGTPACAWMGEAWQNKPPLTIFQEEYEAETARYSEEELRLQSQIALEFEDSYRHQLEWRAVMYGLTAREQELWKEEHKDDPQLPMGPYHHYRPAGLYHTMIEQVAPFAVKGILWYQGESDADHADIYDRTMTALIDCFRTTWADKDLPFLFVQLAPFGHWLDCGNEGYAQIRRQQELVSKQVPHTAMASIMDLGCYEDIHPKFKMEVGRRLALLAQGHVYGFSGLFDPPEFASATRDGCRIMLNFRFADGGLTTDDATAAKNAVPCQRAASTLGSDFAAKNDSLLPQTASAPTAISADGFQVIQNGRAQKITRCSLQGSSVVLTLEQADDAPIAVSYAEEDYCTVHLFNLAGLSAKPFHCTV